MFSFVPGSWGGGVARKDGRNGVAYFRLRIWKLKGLRKGIERKIAPYVKRKKITWLYTEVYIKAKRERKNF